MICPVCNQKIKNVQLHISKKIKFGCLQHLKYKQEFIDSFNLKIDPLLQKYMQIEILEIIQKDFPEIPKNSIATLIRTRIQDLKLNPRKILGQKRQGKRNPVHNEGIKEKISNTVKKRWEEGSYKDRINGMVNLCGIKHPRYGTLYNKGKDNPNYKPEINTTKYKAIHDFNKFLATFQDISKCARCGSTKKIDIHHIDENHDNFLPSNLEPLCVPCHMSYHYKYQKQAFITIGKDFWFAGAHQLPNHKGLCQYLHGHEWKLTISIRKRVDSKTGMVLDFSDLKAIVKNTVINQLDHSLLNDHLYKPTAENLLVWIWEQLMFKGLLKGLYKIEIWESKDSCASINQQEMLSIF